MQKARENSQRWTPSPALQEWQQLLEKPWEKIRRVLLDPSEEGRRLRQSDPVVGILSPQERWEIYRNFPKISSAQIEELGDDLSAEQCLLLEQRLTQLA